MQKIHVKIKVTVDGMLQSHLTVTCCSPCVMDGISYIPRGFRNTGNSWCTKGHASGVMRPLCLP